MWYKNIAGRFFESVTKHASDGRTVIKPMCCHWGRASLQARQSSHYSARNARIACAVLATAIPSVHPSVCPSHAGIVSKRRHVARCSLHCWIAKCV